MYDLPRRAGLEDLQVRTAVQALQGSHPYIRLPIEVVQVCPEGYAVSDGFLAQIRADAVGTATVTHDLVTALRNADVVYTDVWPRATAEVERPHIERLFAPYQITDEMLALPKPDVIFLPCPPVHGGEEVSADVMTSPLCRVYEAKGWLMHAQNALLVTTLADRC